MLEWLIEHYPEMKSFQTVSIIANTLTWLVLLEFLEWPNSPPFVWVFKFWLLLTTVEADVRSKAVSDVSLMPESVIVEEIIDWGSMSSNRWSLTITDVFFFVNEPLPDDPEAMEASSLDVTVCRDVLVLVGIRPVVDDERGFGAIDDMLPTRPSSSSDGIWLFDEGLKTVMLMSIKELETESETDKHSTYTLNKISPLSMCILIVTNSIELSCRWRVS